MEHWVPVSDCLPLSKNISARVVVVEIEESTTLRDGRPFRRFLVADASGSISLVVMGVAARELRPGDVCELRGANTRIKFGKNRMFVPEKSGVSCQSWVYDVI